MSLSLTSTPRPPPPDAAERLERATSDSHAAWLLSVAAWHARFPLLTDAEIYARGLDVLLRNNAWTGPTLRPR